MKIKKLSPRYLGPYQILKRIGSSAYQIALPPHLSNLHDVFHVSQLRKYLPDPSHIIQEERIAVDENLTYRPRPIVILDKDVKQLRNKTIPLVKVGWESLTMEEATWEWADDMRQKYPQLFKDR